MAANFRQIKTIEKKNKDRILAVTYVPETPGIYVFFRYDEEFKFAYVGQAKNLLSRMAKHLSGYQHIDLSLKKHGLYSESNPKGWNFFWTECELHELNELEQEYIKAYANKGFQLRNKTSGSQGVGKRSLDNQKAPKGYYDGLKQGYKNAQKEIAHLFEKHLNYSKKSDKPHKIQEKALVKFEEFLNYEKEE